MFGTKGRTFFISKTGAAVVPCKRRLRGKNMKFTTKQLTQTALLLTLCIISQFMKNTSVYLTGPIINAALLIALWAVNIKASLILCVITPITAFLITGSPITSAIPLMIPVIMIGNAILVLGTWLGEKKGTVIKYVGMGAGCLIKAAFMWIMSSYVLFPIFGQNVASKLPKPEALPKVLETAKVTFSITQLITAVIGCVLAVIIMVPLKKYLKNEES